MNERGQPGCNWNLRPYRRTTVAHISVHLLRRVPVCVVSVVFWARAESKEAHGAQAFLRQPCPCLHFHPSPNKRSLPS